MNRNVSLDMLADRLAAWDTTPEEHKERVADEIAKLERHACSGDGDSVGASRPLDPKLARKFRSRAKPPRTKWRYSNWGGGQSD